MFLDQDHRSVWNFEFWSFFDICDLNFGIYFSVFEANYTPMG